MPSKQELEAQMEVLCKKRLYARNRVRKLQKQWEELRWQYLMKYFKCPVCGAPLKGPYIQINLFDLVDDGFEMRCRKCGCYLEAKGKTIKELFTNLRKKAKEIKKRTK